MSSARSDILKRVRANRASAMPLPTLDEPWQTFEDPVEQFRAVLSSIGASSEVVVNDEAGDSWLSAQTGYAESQHRLSLVSGVGSSTLALDELGEPHELAELDWAVLPGELGVAENGAVWITDRAARHRAVYFLCEHLVLVVNASNVLHNMHQAYEKLTGFGADAEPTFGAFVAGPSKTADIEQSLVIGAQGPRSLAVVIIDDRKDA